MLNIVYASIIGLLLSSCGVAQFASVRDEDDSSLEPQTLDAVGGEIESPQLDSTDPTSLPEEVIIVVVGSKDGDGKKDEPKVPRDCQGQPIQLSRCQVRDIFLPEGRFINMDLTSSDLRGKNLVRSEFRQVSLSSSCGESSEWSDSSLFQTNMEQGHFPLSNFSRTRFESSRLIQANLNLSNFSASQLAQTDLTRACAEASNFSDASFDEQTNACQFKAARSNFSRASFGRQSRFCQADFESANFSAVKIAEEVDFSGSNFRQANFQGAIIHPSAIFTGADLSGATWVDGRRCAANSIGSCR